MTTTVTTSQPKDFHCTPISLHPHVTVELCFLSWSGVFLFPSVSRSRLRAFTCRLPDQVSLLLPTLLLCISMRSDCIVMLHRLQNTHFHLWLSLCGQSKDRLTRGGWRGGGCWAGASVLVLLPKTKLKDRDEQKKGGIIDRKKRNESLLWFIHSSLIHGWACCTTCSLWAMVYYILE